MTQGGQGSKKRTGRRDKEGAVEVVHLNDEIVRELRATARPGKAEILIKVFGEAAGAFAAGNLDHAIQLGDQSKHMALRAASVRELLGLAFYRAGRWQEAARELSAFRRITGSGEQNPVLAGNIVAAGSLADMGRVDEAIARLEALKLHPRVAEPHHLRAWYALADLLERNARFTQAREWFEAVAAADPDVTDAPERARRLRTRG